MNNLILDFNGRGDRIRTCDFLLPKQTLYQPELLPETEIYILYYKPKSKCVFSSLFNESVYAASLNDLNFNLFLIFRIILKGVPHCVL